MLRLLPTTTLANLPLLRAVFLVAMTLSTAPVARAGVPDDAQVVLVVDTSVSMKGSGMDPERTSLLVSRLYADIVPGDFAVIRLLDLDGDRVVLASKRTGRMVPCSPEQGGGTCELIDQVGEGGWEGGARAARGAAREGYGVAIRNGPADAPRFKRLLDAHLRPIARSSMFQLGFRSAQGFFDEGRVAGPRRQFLLWLSDGVADKDGRGSVVRAATDVIGQGVAMEALVFARGNTSIAEELHLTPRLTTSPERIMSAFADVFRRIVQAPFRIDGVVASQPNFSFKPHVREAWVVVFGDTTLASAHVEGPSGRVDCDDASDSVPRAGAYRVARITGPAPGEWSVHVVGGGAAAAYAVIQRPGLRVAFVGPGEASAGLETPLVAAIESDLDGRRITESEILAGITIEIEVDGERVPMLDDGTHGDVLAGDGQYAAPYRFSKVGPARVSVHATSETLDSTARGSVEVGAGLSYAGGPVNLDFGEVKWGETRCLPLQFDADVAGNPEVVLNTLRPLVSEHTVLVRMPTEDVALGTPFTLSPGLQLQLCLVTGDMAPSSVETGEPLLEIRAGAAADAAIPVTARWTVTGRPWWIRYQREIRGVLALLAGAAIAYGWIWPARFERRLGLQVSATPDLDQGGFYAFRQFRGTGAGWYSHAIAYVHDNYRISGRTWRRGVPRGAAVRFRARGKAVRLEAVAGHRVEWTSGDGEWETVPDGEQLASVGRTYRVASVGGLYFEVRRG